MNWEFLRQGILITGMPLILWFSAGGQRGTRNPRVLAPFLVATIGLILMMQADHARGRNFPSHLFLEPGAPYTLQMLIGIVLVLGGFGTSVIVAIRMRDTLRGILDRRSDWLLGELDGAGYSLAELEAAEQDLIALHARVRWVGHADEWITDRVVEKALSHVRETRRSALQVPGVEEINRN